MNWKKTLYVGAMSVGIVLASYGIILACFSSPVPPTCARTIYLAKFTSSNILIPGGGSAFNVPIGVLPFVSWDSGTQACAMPAAASVSLTANCTPAGGGTPFSVGPQMFTTTTPTIPGSQPVPGGTLTMSFAGGTPPATCTIVGTYDVTFGGGINGGLLSGTGDTVVCLVEPSPHDPELPRLDLQLITDNEAEPVLQVHQGDQKNVYVTLSNNDLDRTATFDFKSEGVQVAGFPDGFTTEDQAYDGGVYRISNDDGDVFASGLITSTSITTRLNADPLSSDPQRIDHTVILGPGEVGMFGFAINSFGACADGSCNERNVCSDVELTKDGEDTVHANACGQFVYQVDNSATPGFPGLTVQDDIKVHPQVDAQWSGIRLFDAQGDPIDETHGTNLRSNQRILPHSGIQTTGTDLQGPFNSPYPDTWADQITVPEGTSSAIFEAFIFDQRDNFNQEYNFVQIQGLDQIEEGPCLFPTVRYEDFVATNVFMLFDLDSTCGDGSQVVITINDQEMFNGTLGQLRSAPNFTVDDETCRTISFPNGNLLGAPVLAVDPPFFAGNFQGTGTVQETFNVTLNQSTDAAWTATLEGPAGASLPLSSGTGDLSIDFDIDQFGGPLETRNWNLVVTNNSAVNSPIVVPLVGRKQQQRVAMAQAITAPPLILIDETFPFELTIDPAEFPYENAQCLISVSDNGDPILLRADEPFVIEEVDVSSDDELLNMLRQLIGESTVDECLDNTRACGLLDLGTGNSFDVEIFADGFESGHSNSFRTDCFADNASVNLEERPFGVLDEDKKLPVFTEEELRAAIELFNDDVVFDEKTIGLVSQEFGVEVPLPPIRGTYFFDEFESFRKDDHAPPVTIDGTACESPCNGLVVNATGVTVNGIRFENFPDYGLVVEDSSGTTITRSEFANNGKGGIHIDSASGTMVGGTAEEGNNFIDNAGPGVTVTGGTMNSILSSTFSGNTGPGIDLGGDGVTANDGDDSDTGANNLQNFPDLTRALRDDSNSHFEGLIATAPSSTFTLQFFSNETCHASGNGEGAVFLGEGTAITSPGGTASFTSMPAGTTELGEFITVTATDADGNTSEFSECLAVSGTVSSEQDLLPETLELYQNFPNPFKGETTVRFALPEPTTVSLRVFDMLGREVAVLSEGPMRPGIHDIAVNGRAWQSGHYIYVLETGDRRMVKTLMLVK